VDSYQKNLFINCCRFRWSYKNLLYDILECE